MCFVWGHIIKEHYRHRGLTMPKDGKTRKAEFEARKREQGLKRTEFHLRPGEKEKIQAFIQRLRK